MGYERLDQRYPEKYAHPYTTRSRSWDDIVASYCVWLLVALLFSAHLLGFIIDLRAPPQYWPDYSHLTIGAIVLGLAVVHEALHGIVARAFGMRVTFGVKWYGIVAYTRYYGGRVARWQKAAITLTPVVVITAACVITYQFTTSNELMALALIVLFSHTVASGIDLRNAIALLWVPYGTVFEIPDRESSMAIYEPQEHAVMATSERTTWAQTLPDGELPKNPREPLSHEFNHWLNDLESGARNRHLQATGRAYGHLVWHRFSRWIFAQAPPLRQIHHRSTHG